MERSHYIYLKIISTYFTLNPVVGYVEKLPSCYLSQEEDVVIVAYLKWLK